MTLLYKVISGDMDVDASGNIVFDGPVSFTTKPTSSHGEFGDRIIAVDYDEFEQKYKCIPVIYNYYWMREHPDILRRVTGKSRSEWMDWAREDAEELQLGHLSTNELMSLISEEIENLYSWENEVVVEGDPIIVQPNDIIINMELKEFDAKKEIFVSHGIGRGWHYESQRHALAAKGIKTR